MVGGGCHMNYKHDQGRTLSVVTGFSLLNFMAAHRVWGLEYHPRERDLPRKSFGIYSSIHVWTPIYCTATTRGVRVCVFSPKLLKIGTWIVTNISTYCTAT